jgi:ABC-2 type transport system permease protein
LLVGADDDGLTEALASVPDREIDVEAANTREEAAAAVESGDADLAIVAGTPPVLLVDDETTSLVAIVREVVNGRAAATQLAELGIDAADVSTAFADAAPVIEPIDVERAGREGAAFAITIVLYLLTVVLTSQVAGAVAVEKSNRVSEVLLAIVPPRSMLVGKVIGVGFIGLVTLAAGAAPVVGRLVVGGGLPDGLPRAIAVSALWFVGGLGLYLLLAGALGALVSRQEEVGAVITPLTIILVAGYIAAITAGDSVVGAILSYVPLTSPLVTPYRIAVGDGSPVEYVISLVVLAISVAVVGRVAAVVFRRAIVRTGRRLSLRDVLGRPSQD